MARLERNPDNAASRCAGFLGQFRLYDGLWLREPQQFLHDALPRAYGYLARFAIDPIAVTPAGDEAMAFRWMLLSTAANATMQVSRTHAGDARLDAWTVWLGGDYS